MSSVPNRDVPGQHVAVTGASQFVSSAGGDTAESLAVWAGIDLTLCASDPHADGLVSTVVPRAAFPACVAEAGEAWAVDPLAYCPGCLAEAGQPFPERATTRHCPRCLDRIRRVYQCERWNQDHAHQVAAGLASWDAFSARWRASSGLAPLSVDAARRYVTPEMIRGPFGTLLPDALRQVIYRTWLAGRLIGVVAWLADDPPPDPTGLWTGVPPDVVGGSGQPGGGKLRDVLGGGKENAEGERGRRTRMSDELTRDLLARYAQDDGLWTRGWVTPEEAAVLLAALPGASRRLLAQLVALYVQLEAIPPVSFPATELPAALPLLGAGLVVPESERDQHLWDGPEWGVVPTGLLGVNASMRLFGMLLSLVAGEAWDSWEYYAARAEEMELVRVYPFGGFPSSRPRARSSSPNRWPGIGR